MKNSNVLAVLTVLATLAILPAALGAQTGDVTKPVIVHTLPPSSSRSTTNTEKTNHSGHWMQAQVIHADSELMIVHEMGNEKMVHTFTYADTLKPKMQAIVNNGGYRYGDQVKILFKPETTVALKIHGKPSKTS